MTAQRLNAVLANIGGLEFDPVTIPANKDHLPPFIPQLTNPWFGEELLRGYPVVSVGINRVFCGRSGALNLNLLKAGNVNTWLRLSADTCVLLNSCAEDLVLENVWAELDRRRHFDSLLRLGFWGMIAFDFSIYFSEPRMEHLVNLKRSTVTMRKAALHGLLAIPHIYWATGRDLERLSNWVLDNPTIRMVAFNMQTYTTDALWQWALRGLTDFDRMTGKKLSFILIGVSSRKRTLELLRCLDRLSIITARPAMLAQHYEGIVADAQGNWKRHKLPAQNPEELFRRNTDAMASLMQRLTVGIR